MERRNICLIVSTILLALTSLFLLMLTYEDVDTNGDDILADRQGNCSVSSLSDIFLKEQMRFASQLEGQQTNNPDHWSADGSNSTLRQVLLVVRHGDRLPKSFPARDPLKDEALWKFYGVGELTNLGKARLSLLGRLVRYRYRLFFGNSVRKQIRTSKSSSHPRCFESAQAFLSSFLALSLPNSTDAAHLRWDFGNDNPIAHLWQPADIETLPTSMDGMLAPYFCRAFNDRLADMDRSEFGRRLFTEFHTLTYRLNASVGLELKELNDFMDAAFLVNMENFYFGAETDKTLRDSREQLANIALVIYNQRQSLEGSRRLESGLLANDILTNMRSVQLGGPQKSRKLIHYSTHDLKILFLLGALEVWPQVYKTLDFASNLVLELHEQQSGWFVRLFYMQEVPSMWRELVWPNCKQTHSAGGCSLDEVERSLAKYRLTSWQQWMSECNNSYADLHPYGNENNF